MAIFLRNLCILCYQRATCSIFATKACVDNRKKNLLNSNTSSTCPDNMVNFGPLAAEIGLPVWGTPANFNGFCVLAALLHGTLVGGVSQTAALNRGRHLYLPGWPSRWALVHILVTYVQNCVYADVTCRCLMQKSCRAAMFLIRTASYLWTRWRFVGHRSRKHQMLAGMKSSYWS